jgi:hypothetical protein
MFPEGWENRVLGSRKKRRLVNSKEVPTSESTDGPNEPDDQDDEGIYHSTHPLTSTIMQQLHCSSKTPPVPGDLDLDYILSRVPYRDILESLMAT